jgi:gliding motility-associated-like protein
MSKCILVLTLLISLTTAAQQQPLPQTTTSTISPWDEQEKYVNGFARVLKNNQFSFINQSGALIHALEFDAARNFRSHFAAVKKGDKWGFINELGEVVIPFKYDIVYDFTETVTGVFGNKLWWLINTKGNVMAALDITAFYGFKNGIAKISKHDRWGTINTKAEIVFEKNIQAPAPNNAVQNKFAPTPVNNAITVCPDNIDFEYGNFFNWKCYTGHVDSVGTVNVITLNPSPPTPNRHTLYNRVLPSPIDPFGLFPTNPPDGSNFALKLGNTVVGGEAEGVSYTIRVPANDSNFSIKYDYAVVFEDPGHTIWSQPRFQVKVFDSAANAYVDCASFEYVSTSNLPGFTRSTVDTGVIYKPWSTVFLSLRGYAGKTMYLEFTNADCVRKGHWGYSYIDVEKPCGQSVEMQYDCAAPNITTLTAPPGFQIYNWWDSAFTTILGSGQQITLNPGPAMNTTIWLEMIPFNNFGCLDTIPVKFTGEFTANFDMSDTVGICAPHTFTFYNRDLPSTSAIWDFGDGTTGTGDTVTHTYNLPGNYLVKLNVTQAGGCFGAAIKLVSVVQPAGSFSFASGNYCDTLTVQFNAITSYTDSLFWDFGDGTLLATTQSAVAHTYAAGGIFYPSLIIRSPGGCQTLMPATDSIKIDVIRAGFLHTENKICGSTTINFTDTSSAYFGIASRQWNFGDGTTGTGNIVSHTYTSSGTYTVTLEIIGVSGCRSTIAIPIAVQVNSMPVAAVTGDIEQCLFVPVTFNSTVQSADAILYNHWTCSNGSSGSGNSFTITFTQAGTFTVEFITRTVNGCADTVVHTIKINPTPDVQQPPSQILCNGDFTLPINFSGSVAGTVFNWTNTNTSIGLAATGTGSIASFQAVYNGASVAYATVRVTPTANGCPGAFKTLLLTVHPTPNVAQPQSQALCAGSNTAAITFSGAVTGTTYNWTNNNPSIGLAANGTGNIPAFTATTTGNNTTTATITVTPVANGCPGQAKTFSITVNPMPDVVQVAHQNLCSGSSTAAILFSGAVSGTTYSWTNSNPSIGLAASGTGNIPSFIVTGNIATTSVAVITVTPAINGCTGTPESFNITVNPIPTVAQPVDQILCNNSNTAAITFTGVVSNASYNWTNSNPSIGLAASGTGNIPSFTVTGNATNISTAVITVTPAANGCPGTAKTFTITVNPIPAVVQQPDQNLCEGNFTSAINFSGPVNGTVYNWTNSNPSIGIAANGTGNIPSFSALANGTNTAVATITVSPAANGCPGSPKIFTITVNPVSDVMQPVNQAVCNGATFNATNFTGNIPGAIYNWTNNNTAIGLPSGGSGNISSFTAVNNTSSVIVASITVTPAAATCAGPAKTFLLTVHPTPAVAAGNDAVVCLGKTVQLSVTGAAQYTWTPAANLSCTNCPNPVATPTDTIMYKVKGTSAFGCYAFDSVALNVIKPFKMQVSPNDTLCIGETTGLAAYKANSYLWSPSTGLTRNNIANPTARPNVTTNYRVIGFDGHNCFTDTGYVLITVGPKPTVNLGPDKTLSTGTSLLLNAATSNGPIISWMWTPAADLSCNNCPSPSTVVRNNSFYSVVVTNLFGCIATDTIFINSLCKSAQVFIPNAFTPDGDGLNDVLMVRGKGVTIKSFRIFNRWGELVFEKENFYPNELKYGWDGKVRGVPATPDVFVYTAEVFCDNGIPYTYKGNISLLK